MSLPFYEKVPSAAMGTGSKHRVARLCAFVRPFPVVFSLITCFYVLYLNFYHVQHESYTALKVQRGNDTPWDSNLASNGIYTRGSDLAKNMTERAYTAYWTYAQSSDDLSPQSSRGRNWTCSSGKASLYATAIDSLDTLHLMNLTGLLDDSIRHLKANLRFDHCKWVSTFETTIRVLGGLLSAYDALHDKWFITQALDLGMRLSHAFETPFGIPAYQVNLMTGRNSYYEFGEYATTLADAGTLSMEFIYLERVLQEIDPDNELAWQGVFKGEEWVSNVAWEMTERWRSEWDRAWPQIVNVGARQLIPGARYTIGGGADSFFEYQLKTAMLLSAPSSPASGFWYNNYQDSIDFPIRHLLIHIAPLANVTTSTHPYTLFGEREKGVEGPLTPLLTQLSCFAPGMFILDMLQSGNHNQTMLQLAHDLAETCYELIRIHHLAPESTNVPSFQPEWPLSMNRPETVESLFYLWIYTADPIYRKWTMDILENISKFASCSSDMEDGLSAFCTIHDVATMELEDRMESFIIAETLKYGYLTFQDRTATKEWLKTRVFNTEAHAFTKLGKTT